MKIAGWGNVARRGAGALPRRDEETRAPRAEPRRSAPPPKAAVWVRTDGAGDEWEDAAPPRGRRGRSAPARRPAGSAKEAPAALPHRTLLPADVAAEIRNAADTATARHRERLVERAEAAYGAYERGRFLDAARALKPVAEECPGVAAVRELAGLAAYRNNRWREAVRHLDAFEDLSGSTDHVPVVMDCQRALHKRKKVADLWSELRQSSPDPDVLAEGRIVAAAALADAGDLEGAVAMLATAGATKALRNPSERHVRQWYLLGDLYERAGDLPRARQYFERVGKADPGAYDVAERLRGLGPSRSRPRRTSRPKAAPRAQGSSDAAG